MPASPILTACRAVRGRGGLGRPGALGFALEALANAPRADVAAALARYSDLLLPEAERIVVVLSAALPPMERGPGI